LEFHFRLDKFARRARHTVKHVRTRPQTALRRARQPLYAFLLNLTRDEPDTRDLLQDIFVKLARDPELLAGVRDERAFLVRLAHNARLI